MNHSVSMPGFEYKFGKAAARPDSIRLKFSDFADIPELRRLLPDLPKRPLGPFGHEHIIKEADYGMLANDKYGCCVFSGSAHETKMLAGLGKKQVWFNDKNVLADYSELTGFDPKKPETDVGTDMQKAARYRQNKGIRDGHGKRHMIAAYMSIDPGNLEQHLMALYLFGTVGIGIEVPAYAPEQFNANHPWDVQTVKTKIVGGHYIPLTYWHGDTSQQMDVITWGAFQKMTPGFLARYNDESVTYLSDEMFVNRKSPEGFDYETLLAHLQQIRNVG